MSAEAAERPAVTVLIGSWNSGRTLERAIDAVLSQTLKSLELIVVDDGSTDDTAQIATSTGDPRVRHLELIHMGISASLNHGLRAARSELVAIQDADDWSAPARMERQASVLRERPEVAVVGCRMNEVDATGRALKPRFGRSMASTRGDVTDRLLRYNPIPNSCAMLRRDVVLGLGGYDPRYSYAMEYDLWLRVAERSRVVLLDEALATREMGGGNVAATRESEQVRETVRLKVAAMQRRRSVAGARGLIHPVASAVAPLAVKRAGRRLRGMAP